MSNLLRTDGYKFSMAQAGYPLRRERFYFSFRRGGWHYNPFDLEEMVEKLKPVASDVELTYLANNNYRLTEAMRQALSADVSVEAIPKGTWFCNQEPILSVEAPSFVVSHMEASITMLNYQIQLATRLKSVAPREGDVLIIKTICAEHDVIVLRVAELVGVKVKVERIKDYQETLLETAQDIVESLDGGDVGLRIVEGGLRSAICHEHHRMVLGACAEFGIVRTSNVEGAYSLEGGLIPSGTAGHEHSQRCGSDRVAYTNYADRVCGLVSCLADTWSTLDSGLPNTIRMARSLPERQFLFRLDSGDRAAYFHYCANKFKEEGIDNVIINVAGDVNAEMIRKFEALRKIVGWDANRLSYMIGGQLTAATLPTDLTRGKVASVFKLCETGGRPTMKMGDDVGHGKRSWPGKPTLFRRLRGDGPIGIIGQRGEEIENYADLHAPGLAQGELSITGANRLSTHSHIHPVTPSPATQNLIDICEG